MIKVGVTGGIGSGKSYVCHRIEAAGFPVFYTDEAARLEMAENASLRSSLRNLVAPNVFRANGELDKDVMRAFLQMSPGNAAVVDGAVHPCVRERWRRWAWKQEAEIVVMECALLFEAHFDTEVDYKLFVSAPRNERLRRVMERDGADVETVKRWMEMQMPDGEKSQLCDFVVCNDGLQDIDPQLRRVAEAIGHNRRCASIISET